MSYINIDKYQALFLLSKFKKVYLEEANDFTKVNYVIQSNDIKNVSYTRNNIALTIKNEHDCLVFLLRDSSFITTKYYWYYDNFKLCFTKAGRTWRKIKKMILKEDNERIKRIRNEEKAINSKKFYKRVYSIYDEEIDAIILGDNE